MPTIPTTQKEWRVQGRNGPDSLVFKPDAPVPQLGDRDVLVKLKAASLNYRDLIIPRGLYPFPAKDEVVPVSDGAGEVVAVGPGVTRFKPGDKVVTLFNQDHIAGSLDRATIASGLGGMIDGVLRQYGAFYQEGLVPLPPNLDFLAAATLPCAALTAWNALYGLAPLKPGQWVVTQGTGGVSMFALQFAKAAGARVIATTSSTAKADRLRELGADVVFNYNETPNWGEEAKKLTNGRGVDHVVEVGGPKTLTQSVKAIRIDGVISIIGFVGGMKAEEQPTFVDTLANVCTVRGIFVGSRQQMEDMGRAIEAENIKPVVDAKVFTLEKAKEAYQYQWDQKHFGKVVISID